MAKLRPEDERTETRQRTQHTAYTRKRRTLHVQCACVCVRAHAQRLICIIDFVSPLVLIVVPCSRTFTCTARGPVGRVA